MIDHYNTLMAIIHYYDTVMTIMPIIAISALISLFSIEEVSTEIPVWVTHKNAVLGNTPRVSCWRRIPAEWSPRAVHDMDLELLGSAHGVPTDELHLRCWAMPARESNSLLQLAHLKPNDSGNCFGPLGFPLPTPRRMLWMAFNLLQFSACGPIDALANCSKTGTKQCSKHNTKNKRTILCIATDGSVSWMCTHHWRFHILKGKTQKFRKSTLKWMKII